MLLPRIATQKLFISTFNNKIINFKLFKNYSISKEKLIIENFKRMENNIKVRENPIVTKLDSPEFKSIFNNELNGLIDLFSKYNYELRLAGGAVRDILMNIHPKDIDLATTATPDEMKEMFTKENIRMINTKGEKHGTITPRINDKENFEVTTLRIDVLTDGRHADVLFTTDWQLDANRRDLTINSMFMGLDGSVYDYFYGFDDLKLKRIVFVGNADTRIKEDFLRILRYFRFYGRISEKPNNHDDYTIKAITENVAGLQRISGERIWSEIKRTLEGNFALEQMIKLLGCGAGDYIGLPKNPNLDEIKRVFEDCKKFDVQCLPISFMSALLNNVDDAIKLHERLKFSAFERDLSLFITQNRGDLKNIDDIIIYKKLSMQPFAKREYIMEIIKYLGKLETYEEFKNWQIPTFGITGHTLKEKGCPPGKVFGLVMSELKLIWADDNFQTSVEDLLNIHLPKILENHKKSKYNNKKQKTKK